MCEIQMEQPIANAESKQVQGLVLKLNSYSNASVFLSLCRMRISVCWDHERLTNRSISKCYLEQYHYMSWKKLNFKSVSRSWHRILLVIWKWKACFIASSGVWVWMKMQSDKKTLAFEYEFSLNCLGNLATFN